jgi:hypothetical protein
LEKTGWYGITVIAGKSRLNLARHIEGLFSLRTLPPKVLQTGIEIDLTLAGYSSLFAASRLKRDRFNQREYIVRGRKIR